MAARLSTVHRGTAFEQRSLELLRNHLSMTLDRVGGKSDGGVDLLGWWWLPGPGPHGTQPSEESNDSVHLPRRRIRVLGQCKAEKKKFGPNYLREMEGVMHRHIMAKSSALARGRPAESSESLLDKEDGVDGSAEELSNDIVAVVVSESPFSKAAFLRAVSSPIPFLLLHLPPPVTPGLASSTTTSEYGTMGSAFWNAALGGTQGILKGELDLRWEQRADGEGRPGLWMDGRRILNSLPGTPF